MNPIAETPEAELVPSATIGEFRPVSLGPIQLWPPVVLAPMAGVTNYPFRSLCCAMGAPLCVGEMVTARPLVQRVARTMALAAFGARESPRSIQLYGTDPYWLSEATHYLVDVLRADHVDLNFGCPVRKVTVQGGGAALPHKPRLLAKIIRAVVSKAGNVPVTAKFRLGVDAEHLIHVQTGRIAQEEGCRAVTLHARTAAELYANQADWQKIAELKRTLSIPVFGNGDIWEAADALRMMRETQCDGVVIGRGCLGKPWLFRDLLAMFSGRRPAVAPTVGEVLHIMLDHAQRQVDWLGEKPGITSFRRQAAWYTKGFRSSAVFRQQLMQIESLEGLKSAVNSIDGAAAFPALALRVPRCKDSGMQRVALPDGFWSNLESDVTPAEHDCGDGG